jgi:hypothetical protein
METNNNIKNQAIILMIIMIIIMLIIIIYCYKFVGDDFNLFEIIIKNLIILFFAALTEYCFLKYYASNYISARPNQIKFNLSTQINKIINTIRTLYNQEK